MHGLTVLIEATIDGTRKWAFAALVVAVVLSGCLDGTPDRLTTMHDTMPTGPEPKEEPATTPEPVVDAEAAAPAQEARCRADRAPAGTGHGPLPPCPARPRTIKLLAATMLEAGWLIPEEQVEPFLPEGFEPATIFMGDPYPEGTTGLYLYALNYENGSLDETPLENGRLAYWGLHVTPPPEHAGPEFHFLQVSAFADDALVAEALQEWDVPGAQDATIQIMGGWTDSITTPHWTHNRLTIDAPEIDFTVDFAVHGLAECAGGGGCHQSRTPIRMFGVENQQVTGYIDLVFDPSNVFILGASFVSYTAPPPPEPYPWPGPGIAGRFAADLQVLTFEHVPAS